MAELSSKQRVERTFRYQETDRVPINYLCNQGIDSRLKKHFGLDANDGEGLLRALNVDFRGIGPRYIGPRLHAEVEGINVDPQWGLHTRWIEHESGGYNDYCDYPLMYADDDTIRNWPMPSPDDYDYSKIASYVGSIGDLAIFAGGAGTADIMNSAGMMFGVEEMLVRLISEDDAFLVYTDRRLGVQLECLRRTLEACPRGALSFVWLGEDLGTQIGPMIGLDLYRKVLRPRHQKFIDLAAQFDLPVMVHTCGSSSWAYEDFIDMGVKVVDTLQPEAVNMSPSYLKQNFGGRLAFHGCISTAGPMANGTVEQVVADCKQVLETMMPGGGYCFAPTHCIQDNSPTENVLAAYQTAYELGRY